MSLRNNKEIKLSHTNECGRCLHAGKVVACNAGIPHGQLFLSQLLHVLFGSCEWVGKAAENRPKVWDSAMCESSKKLLAPGFGIVEARVPHVSPF